MENDNEWPTNHLRFVARASDINPESPVRYILQQKWEIFTEDTEETVDFAEEWRDVPVALEV